MGSVHDIKSGSKKKALVAFKQQLALKKPPEIKFITTSLSGVNKNSVLSFKEGSYYQIPLYLSKVSAGSPTLVDEAVDQYIDLPKDMVPNPETCFCLKVSGDSMLDAGIHEGDLLVVDSQKKPITNNIVVASIHGELTVKRLKIFGNRCFLVPENPKFKILKITEEMDFKILGVVLHVFHSKNLS